MQVDSRRCMCLHSRGAPGLPHTCRVCSTCAPVHAWETTRQPITIGWSKWVTTQVPDCETGWAYYGSSSRLHVHDVARHGFLGRLLDAIQVMLWCTILLGNTRRATGNRIPTEASERELKARIQELQNEVNCMNDSRDFQDAESFRSGLSHVPSQPALLPPYRDPGGMLSHPGRMLRRNEKPPDIWDTHGMSGKVFFLTNGVLFSTLSRRILT